MSTCESLYTSDELVDFIKAIDLQLNSAVSKTSIDTGQSKHELSLSVRTLREQREYYISILQIQDPCRYKATFGSSIIKFRGNSCRY